MTSKERKLLLMVSKDIRRLWDRNPEAFGVMPGYALYANRKNQYDAAIKEVEDGKAHEAESRND